MFTRVVDVAPSAARLLLDYRQLIELNVPAYARRGRGTVEQGLSVREHLLSMIDRMTMFTVSRAVKFDRWLGFLQGALWCLNLRSVDELVNETRGAVHDEIERACKGAFGKDRSERIVRR